MGESQDLDSGGVPFDNTANEDRLDSLEAKQDLELQILTSDYKIGEAFRHTDGLNYRVKIAAPAGETPTTDPTKFEEMGGLGLITPWTSNIDAAGFNLDNLSVLTSNAPFPATVGNIRLGEAESITWRNNANSSNLFLDVNATDQLTFNGTVLGLNGIYSGSGTLTADATIAGDGLSDFNIGTIANPIVSGTDVYRSDYTRSVNGGTGSAMTTQILDFLYIAGVQDNNALKQSKITLSATSIKLEHSRNLTGDISSFEITDTALIFTDKSATALGVQYAADYSANFTARSLVDKAYVDGLIGGAGDVTGPASSLDNELPRYDGLTGKIIQASTNIFIDDAGNLGINTSSPSAALQVRGKPSDSGTFTAEDVAGAMLRTLNNNGGNTPSASESGLILVRAGIGGQAFANYTRFDLSRYENVGASSRTQLDFRLSHGDLSVEGNDTPIIMSLQSGGNVGIGNAAPDTKLHITDASNLTTLTLGAIGTNREVLELTYNSTSSTGSIRCATLGVSFSAFDVAASEIDFRTGATAVVSALYIDSDRRVTVNPTTQTTSADASAQLAVESTTRGFLPPKMTITQRLAIVTPTSGLMVYDITLNQWYGWNNSSWVILG